MNGTPASWHKRTISTTSSLRFREHHRARPRAERRQAIRFVRRKRAGVRQQTLGAETVARVPRPGPVAAFVANHYKLTPAVVASTLRLDYNAYGLPLRLTSGGAMDWTQTYDPLGNVVSFNRAVPQCRSSCCWAGLAFRPPARPRRGARSGSPRRLLVAIAHLRHADAAGAGDRRLRRRLRAAADRLDRPQRHFSVSAHLRRRAVRHAAPQHHGGHARHAAAAAARRLLLWRVLRRRVGIRHAGRHHRRAADRSWLHAAGCVRSVAHRQHRAGRVRRARHADHRAARRDQSRSLRAERDGRPAAAVLLAHRAVLADLGLCGAPRHARRLARDSGCRRRRSRRCSSWCRTITALARGHPRVGRLDRRRRAVSPGVAAVAIGWRTPTRRLRRAQSPDGQSRRIGAASSPM